MPNSSRRASVEWEAQIQAGFVYGPGYGRTIDGLVTRNLLLGRPGLKRHSQPLETDITWPTMPWALIALRSAATQILIQSARECILDSHVGLVPRFYLGIVAIAFKTKYGWLPASERWKLQTSADNKRRLPAPSLYRITSALYHPFALDSLTPTPGSKRYQQVCLCEVLGVNRVKIFQCGPTVNLK